MVILRLSPRAVVSQPASGEKGVERHYSRSSNSHNNSRERGGGGGQSTLPSVFSILPAFSHAPPEALAPNTVAAERGGRQL
jgi:hypothetical protein